MDEVHTQLSTSQLHSSLICFTTFQRHRIPYRIKCRGMPALSSIPALSCSVLCFTDNMLLLQCRPHGKEGTKRGRSFQEGPRESSLFPSTRSKGLNFLHGNYGKRGERPVQDIHPVEVEASHRGEKLLLPCRAVALCSTSSQT